MNLKPIKLLFLFILSIFISNCSSDDSSDNTPNQPENQVTFNGTSYSITTAWINDENTTTNDPSEIGVNLFNKTTEEINSGNDLTNITRVYFDFDDVTVQETTYTQITDYDFSINGSVTNGVFNNGTVLLSDEDPLSDFYASSGSVIINSISESTVNLEFTFTRNDGQVISGSYFGNYIDPN
jgi:hypothetical protein